MAPRVRAGFKAVRTGSRVVRGLLRSPSPGLPRLAQPDPWLRPRGPAWHLERGRNLSRRAAGLLVLVLLSLLGAGVVGLAVLLLGLGVLQGSDLAGWLLALTLLLALLGLLWAMRRAGQLIRTDSQVSGGTAASDLPQDEEQLLSVLRTHQRALPPPTRAAFQTTVLATRDALRLTAGDTTLERDVYDARQAAREDLPELMQAYQSAPRDARTDRELLDQLRLIEDRMQRVVQVRGEAKGRALRAHGRYLQDKYDPRADQDET
ncbi:hypothetical protein DEDE109153_10515 [Deinococcus deserti]|uniref:Uncharacterized protein n=1 Tax=Deinococcus deserti (strain DSM 17065 / CIP 109153 / LMG 22923 / VCD115) TaxID=546414 RepID=C1CX08_DEIDV|nr:hypothetical protein [Deinococcus deserti]ACO46725.2 hypothetical protein Deide_17520 [Deinococcus deserti VCD115]